MSISDSEHQLVRRHRSDLLAALLIGLAISVFFAWRILSSIAAGTVDNAVFGADHAENLRALGDHRPWGLGYAKHLAAVIWAAATILPVQLLGVPTGLASAISFAVALGGGQGAQFLALRYLGAPRKGAIALTLLSLSAYSYSTAGSVLDIYALTVAAVQGGILLMLWLPGPVLARLGNPVAAGLAAAAAALVNIPAAAYALVTSQLLAKHDRWLARVRAMVIAGLCAAAIGAIPLAGLGLTTGAGERQAAAVQQWASIDHFSDPVILSDYGATLAAFSLVSPTAQVQCRYLAPQMADYVADPLRLLALAGWWLLLGTGIAIGLRSSGRWLVGSALLASMGIALFYVYFAPQAAQLFAVQLLPAQILVILPVIQRWKHAWLPVGAVAMLAAIVNWPALANSPVNDFAAMCPPELAVNGGL